jgi:hypothetical protein
LSRDSTDDLEDILERWTSAFPDDENTNPGGLNSDNFGNLINLLKTNGINQLKWLSCTH